MTTLAYILAAIAVALLVTYELRRRASIRAFERKRRRQKLDVAMACCEAEGDFSVPSAGVTFGLGLPPSDAPHPEPNTEATTMYPEHWKHAKASGMSRGEFESLAARCEAIVEVKP
jgi:hypothetical protein